MENKTAKAYLRYVRISPRKVQIVCDLIRGKDAGTALAILAQTPKAASEPLTKLLKSAVANAENNFGMDPAGEKLCHGFLNRDFLFYGFSGFLGVLIILSGTGNKLFENAILQFKAHCPIIIDFRS